MKKFVTAGIIIHIFFLYSCDPAATFNKPQPDNVTPLSSIPERIQGKYINPSQTTTISIIDSLITRNYKADYKAHKDSIGSSYRLVGDTLVDTLYGTKEKVFIKGDSIIHQANWTDTLFHLSADNVLKKFKGYYFLNLRYYDSTWEVKKLSLKHGVLTIGSISLKDDIEKLNDLKESTDDTISTHITLSKAHFRKFVRQKGFSEEETYNRIATNDR